MFQQMGKRTGVEATRRKASGFNEGPNQGNAAGSVNRDSQAANRQRIQLHFDVILLLSVITLMVFGIVMVYSASYDFSNIWYGSQMSMFYRQMIWLVIGIAAAVFLTIYDYHLLKRYVVPMMIVTIVLLVLVLIVNEVLLGAARTLLQGSIQPSELAKLMVIIYLSVWLSAKREVLSSISFGLFPLAIILGVLGGLIMLQPDISAVATIFMLGGLMFFLAGGDLKQILLLMIVAVLIGWIIVQFNPTGSDRIEKYLLGLKDPTQGSYHVQRSLEAIIRGGWFGVGIGKSETKLNGLPVPPTDSIFAVVGEETGVLGASLLVILFSILLWRGLRISQQAPDELGAMLAGGLCIWIALEAFINMAVMVNLLPFAGNALPFISAGGSNLGVTLAAVGILLNISRLSVQKREEQGRQFNALVDLRWRDRRRRVSSTRRTARNEK